MYVVCLTNEPDAMVFMQPKGFYNTISSLYADDTTQE